MKQNSLLMLMVIALASPLSVLAEQPMQSETAAGTAASESAVAMPGQTGHHHAAQERGMMHSGKHQHRSREGMKHGGGHHDKHADVLLRLDMIEARMAIADMSEDD